MIGFEKAVSKLFALLLLFCILGKQEIHAQHEFFDNYYNRFAALIHEKVYLHTDRDMYTTGENIWFKIYLMDGKNHIPLFGLNTVYLTIINPAGDIKFHKPFMVFNGTGFGNFTISDSLATGNYDLYAYTNYMKNYGVESFFRKEISISQILVDKVGQVFEGQTQLSAGLPENISGISLHFMPEGGYLSNNLINTLGFKLVDYNGEGLNFRGSIIDSAGSFIKAIEASHYGMGKVSFTPDPDMKYYAISADFLYDTIPLPASFDRPQLHYAGINDSIVQFRINDFSAYSNERIYYVAIKAKGELSFYIERKMNTSISSMNVHINTFRPGLNKAILLDSNFTPLAERLFFIPGIPQGELSLRTDQRAYKIRERTEVSIEIKREEDKGEGGSFSVAVINLEQTGNKMPHENIISYLELSSEIRGKIEDPAHYFLQPFDSINEELDLLLLTQGWSKYIWDENYIESLPEFSHEKETGFSIRGYAERLILNQALEEGNIILLVPSEFIIMETTTDSNGFFSFDNVILSDSTKIAVQSKNKRNKQSSRLIDVNSVITPPPDIPPSMSFYSDTLSLQYYNKLAYSRFLSKRNQNFDKSNILLEEVTIVGKKKEEDDGHFRMYSQASNVINMDDYPSYAHSDLLMFLQGLVPGLFISGDNISIRRASGTPLLLLDGMEIDVSMARSIPLNVVDKIEVLKDAANTAVYGLRGGNGVIAIYTRRGESVYYESPTLGLITKSVDGFARAREFYAPDYDDPESSKPVIDRRATIYWEPNLIPDSTGVAKVSFFNSDDTGKTGVFVEGILFNGKPGVATEFYWVE